MKEFMVAQNGATEYLVLRLIGDIYHVIARSGSRDYADLIVASLNPEQEHRLGYADLR